MPGKLRFVSICTKHLIYFFHSSRLSKKRFRIFLFFSLFILFCTLWNVWQPLHSLHLQFKWRLRFWSKEWLQKHQRLQGQRNILNYGREEFSKEMGCIFSYAKSAQTIVYQIEWLMNAYYSYTAARAPMLFRWRL